MTEYYDNKNVSSVLRLLAQLQELYDDNPFRIRSYNIAAEQIRRLEKPVVNMSLEELQSIKGIGQAIAKKIYSFVHNGSFPLLDRLMEQTPSGIIDLLSVKGLGPKKIKILWKNMGIESLGELLYACNENRLLKVKGFGEKTQKQIKKEIEFILANKGKFLFPVLEKINNEIIKLVHSFPFINKLSETGDLRRKSSVLDKLEYVIDISKENIKDFILFLKKNNFDILSANENKILTNSEFNIPVDFYLSYKNDFDFILLQSTGSKKHIKALNLSKEKLSFNEEEIYKANNMYFVPPECREGGFEIEFSKSNDFSGLINLQDIKGLVHIHTTYSDGADTLESIAEFAKNLGFEYIVISDHSKSAFYAHGLKENDILKQHKKIDELNFKLKPFKIFKGIESDILLNGNLDYSDDILSTFDLVIASIHSSLNMDIDKATKRIINAVENPHTTILGHLTGRLLITRNGYPVNHKKIIDACAANNVSIELNANPYRLDIDWKYLQYAMKKNVLISINPDAHSKEGIFDIKYGVYAARKGGLLKKFTLNALSKNDFEKIIYAKTNY